MNGTKNNPKKKIPEKIEMRDAMKISTLLLIAILTVTTLRAQQNFKVTRAVSITSQSNVKLELTVNELPSAVSKFKVRIFDDHETIFESSISWTSADAGKKKLIFYINDLKPQLWTPTHPQLYQLQLSSDEPNQPVLVQQRIGFRFFESKNGNLYLNGKPIFLRGIAINPPVRGIPVNLERSRGFATDYIRFMKSIHVNIIRIPNDSTWYNVCDELGMMVFGGNYGGSVGGEKPPSDYDKGVKWYTDSGYAIIAGHPSLMIYAMTNEVPPSGKVGERWEKFLSYAHAALIKWDSTRSYIANAGYGYGKSGDICDLHRYWGWYYNSPFTFLGIRNNENIIPFKKKVQPITFTECVGNYTGPDGRYNLTPNHKNPGSQLNWTGHADWQVQAQLADEHQSFTFRQATELFRRLRSVNSELSGVFPFTIMFHNWHTITIFTDMDPKAVTRQAQLSYQPVLISWESYANQVYAGSNINPVIHIVNDDDDFNDLTNTKVIYQLLDETRAPVISDTIAIPTVKYYGTHREPLNIKTPDNLPQGNYLLNAKLISKGKIISENFQKIYVARKDQLAALPSTGKKVYLYDPAGKTRAAFNKWNLESAQVVELKNIPATVTVIVGENAVDDKLVSNASYLKAFIKNGGRIIFLRQDTAHFKKMASLIPFKLKNVKPDLDEAAYPPAVRPSRNGYYLNAERPEHPVVAGIRREQLRVWSDYTSWNETKQGFPAIYPVTDGFVPENKNDIENIAVLLNFGVALEGIAVAEMYDGKGSAMICGLDLASRAGIDPVADKMFHNIVTYMNNDKIHDRYQLITEPIVWGDYTSEKGILTGVNSGLLLNAKPRLTGLYANERLIVSKAGDMLGGQSSGFNTRPGVQYVPWGRRPFGPYYLRGFGNVPMPVDTSNNIGTGVFWCTVPRGKKTASTLVYNPSDEALSIEIGINEMQKVSRLVPAKENVQVDCPVNSTTIKMRFTGDRRLVILETSFLN